jgi:hypothetical protein
MKKWILAFTMLCGFGYAEPPRSIPKDLYPSYTLMNQIQVRYAYYNDAYSSDAPLFYRKDQIDQMIGQVKRGECAYYGYTDLWLYAVLDKYKEFVEGKSVAVIGSNVPWYESVVLAYQGNPTTIEYNKIVSDDSRLTLLTVNEYDQNPEQYDVILSISSIEHDGLGRYGDPIDPFGDFKAMERMKKMLTTGGLLFLAVPVGQDCLVWNAHRVYGKIRLPRLFEGWEVVDSSGFQENDFTRDADHFIQPVFVLRSL